MVEEKMRIPLLKILYLLGLKKEEACVYIHIFPSCFKRFKKIACLQSCDDDVHVCLFPCNHVMRKKKLVRLEMVRRSLRMRADIRIMKHLVTWPTSKVVLYVGSIEHIFKQEGMRGLYRGLSPTVMALLSKLGGLFHNMRITNSAGLLQPTLPLIILFGLSRLVFSHVAIQVINQWMI
uniref:Uncharacterized protein n=1 Tax=Brassica oleracea TaxID=3712 RepID=A0A3P6DBI1_BRAOL|nr:unnamed protein product [Brassica oleracea]